jgi:GGDEF domain-containing protein
MRTLARAATSSLIMLGAALALVVAAVAVIGIGGTRAATGQGNEIAGDELATAVVTGQLARSMDAAYAAGLAAVQASVPAERARLLGSLYTTLLPAVDARLFALDQLHADDPPAEHADIARFGRQWAAVRALLSPADLPAAPTSAAAATGQAATGQAGSAQAGSALIAAYAPVSAHLGQLFQRELGDARTDHADADAGAVRAIGLIAGAAALGLALGAVFLARGIRRIRGSLEPSQDQAEFADTLQIAGDEDGGRAALLSCPVCAPVAGTSCCVPLTVGGEVIGSVLLSRPEPYSEAEEQRIRESVGQAAPVLANLRNLAVAEIRAATDGLTGLPNKRAVTDALKRTFAQAMTTQVPLSLLLLDLDHFKQVNDQRGHQVGDQVLANVGATLRNVLRVRDFAGRNGGEEFAVLLPDTSITEALEIAERLADAALYLAKRQGRNRVELADPSPAPAANGAGPLTEAAHRP